MGHTDVGGAGPECRHVADIEALQPRPTGVDKVRQKRGHTLFRRSPRQGERRRTFRIRGTGMDSVTAILPYCRTADAVISLPGEVARLVGAQGRASDIAVGEREPETGLFALVAVHAAGVVKLYLTPYRFLASDRVYLQPPYRRSFLRRSICPDKKRTPAVG